MNACGHMQARLACTHAPHGMSQSTCSRFTPSHDHAAPSMAVLLPSTTRPFQHYPYSAEREVRMAHPVSALPKATSRALRAVQPTAALLLLQLVQRVLPGWRPGRNVQRTSELMFHTRTLVMPSSLSSCVLPAGAAAAVSISILPLGSAGPRGTGHLDWSAVCRQQRGEWCSCMPIRQRAK